MMEYGVMLYLMMLLNQLKNDAFRFKKDEDGAALIEYTVLLGILLVAVIAIIGLVGTWINGQWNALQGQLT
jgi:pilus assembly protein Flp/PilA